MVNQKEELISTTHPTAHSAKENLSFIIITEKRHPLSNDFTCCVNVKK